MAVMTVVGAIAGLIGASREPPGSMVALRNEWHWTVTDRPTSGVGHALQAVPLERKMTALRMFLVAGRLAV